MAFSMEVADVTAVKEEVAVQTKPVPEEELKLREQATTNALAIMSCNLDSIEEKRGFVKSMEAFGADSIARSNSKNTLLKTTVGNLSKSGDEGGPVAKSLMDLSREVKDLDPSAIDFMKGGKIGKLFNPVRNYFAKFERADDVIEGIIKSLDKGRETLKNDNVTLEIEEQALRETTKKMNKEIAMGAMLDEEISRQLDLARASDSDPDKIRFVEEEILFPLRQRIMDMQQVVAVNHQGIVAMEIIRRNNRELMNGVDRAKNVTVTALRTAVTIASALYNQKIVLKKIQALNETTNNIIANTSRMLKEQGAEIAKQASETNISIDVLKQSFDDVMSALDTISTYKRESLPKMRETIEQFRELADKGEAEISKLERGSTMLKLTE